MEFSILKTKKLSKYLSVFFRFYMLLCRFCKKIEFGATKEKKVMEIRRKSTYEPYLQAMDNTYESIGDPRR